MQSFVISVAAAIIGGLIFSMLAPKGNTKKVLNFTLGLFFLSSLLSPFILNVKNININSIIGEIADSETIENITNEQTVKIANKRLENTIYILLKENGYKVEELNIEINLEGQNTSIEAILNEEERKDELAIEKLIKNQTGITPKIVYYE